MPDVLDLAVRGLVMGIAGSALMDAWSAALRRFRIPTLDYRFLGRWIGHFPKGRFVHDGIATSASVASIVFLAPSLVAELSLALWLLARGVDVPKWMRVHGAQTP